MSTESRPPKIQNPLRLRALRDSGLLDSPAEPIFDQLTHLATRLLGVPVALISLVDQDRQFFKAQCGLPAGVADERETPLSHSFCQHVVAHGDPLIVEDARENPLVKDNLAVPDLGVIAYAGMPLKDSDGHVLGAFCAIDGQPRAWSASQLEILRALADQVIIELALRMNTRSQENTISDLEDAAATQAATINDLRAAVVSQNQMARLDRHDLRTPLNSLLLNLQAIPHFGPLATGQQECLDAALRNGADLSRMIDQMVDIGNIDHRGELILTLAECSAAGLVSAATAQVAALIEEKKLRLVTSVPDGLKFPCDTEKLTRVLVNLLSNAVKFTPAGGEIHVHAARIENEVRIDVRDTGQGMAPEDVEQLFTEGFRVDSAAPTRRSTGLGLTFCHRVVSAHGGHIQVESQLDCGTRFSVYLPGDRRKVTDRRAHH